MTRTTRSVLLLTLVMALLAPAWPPAGATPGQLAGVVPQAAPGAAWNKDELLFHRTNGHYHVKDATTARGFGSAVRTDSVSSSWDVMVPIDLDGDRQDEVMFYDRSTGRYRFHQIGSSGAVGGTIATGTFTASWSLLRAIDLDGDQRDELLLYKASSGAYRYLDVGTSGRFGSTIRSGTYSSGYAEIAAIDLDGDQQDEIAFYRSNGRYRYSQIGSTGAIGATVRIGSYGSWTSITAVDADSSASDEILFYSKSTRRYLIFNIGTTAALGTASSSGTLSSAWSTVAGLNVDTSTSAAHPFVAEIIRLVNAERADAGLGAVTSHASAQAEALRWSRVMAGEGRIRHRSDLFHGLPANARIVGENVALGYTSPAAVVAGWMASSGHRANILNPSFTRIGVGVASDSSGTLYYTQIFFGT